MMNHSIALSAFNEYLQRRGEYPDTIIRCPDPAVLDICRRSPLMATGAANIYLLGVAAGKIDMLTLERMTYEALGYEAGVVVGVMLHNKGRKEKGFFGRAKKKLGNFLYWRCIDKLYEMLESNNLAFAEQRRHEAIESFARLRKYPLKIPVDRFVARNVDRLFEERLPSYLDFYRSG